MKLYQYIPDGYGPKTFSVVAESQEAAFAIVDAYVKEKYGTYLPERQEKIEQDEHGTLISPYYAARWEYDGYADGWGTTDYECFVHSVGKVAEAF